MVGKVPDTLSGALDDITKPQADAVAAFKDAGKEMHDTYFVQSYYQDRQLGNDTTIKNMQFSYRDTEDQERGTSIWSKSDGQEVAVTQVTRIDKSPSDNHIFIGLLDGYKRRTINYK